MKTRETKADRAARKVGRRRQQLREERARGSSTERLTPFSVRTVPLPVNPDAETLAQLDGGD